MNYVSAQELQTVLRLVQHTWWQTLMILAYCSGGRRNELLTLTWADIDFEQRNVCFSSKEASEELLAWEPKDHEIRVIPIPEKAVRLLAIMQNEAEEGSPYVFTQKERLAHILSRREKGTWNTKRDLINNLMRDLEVMCCHAGVKRFTLHDLRRSCITNWAQVLPIHVVQRLAGHSDIKTTQRYYLAVRERARQFQSEILGADLSDPKLTHSGKNQCFQRK